MGVLRLVEGADLTAAQRLRAREIYEDGFPEEWLRAEFDALFGDEVLVAFTDTDEVAGLAVVRALSDTGWCFVRYFVAGLRGQGVGSALWAALAAHRSTLGDTHLVLDVEAPDEPGTDAAERTVRERRIAFYERNGLVLLPVDGYAPPHGEEEVHPMRLMLADLRRPAGQPTEVPDRGGIRQLVLAVFAHRYGQGAGAASTRAALEASGL